MMHHCHSCAAPLDDPQFKGNSDRYCRYCLDASGKLVSRQQATQNLIGWFKTWQPPTSDDELTRRAEHYMRSMPAWANA